MAAQPDSLQITALPGLPLIQPGDDLVPIILEGVSRAGLALQDGDALVITSKIVSKSEGRIVDLNTVEVSAAAQALAVETRKDPRIVELVLRESAMVSRQAPGVLVTQHRLGFVSANAGIDQSNLKGNDEWALLLPIDPDATARQIQAAVKDKTGTAVGIVISDSHGRPFRMGNVGVAIGVAGIPALLDLRGRDDLFGRPLHISMQGYADLVASAAHLLSGEANEGRPVVHLRGLNFPLVDGRASDLVRPVEQDLYR
ncbi:MAG: coenzyme F420-0:L-glutamate ligase [Anaerolineaceae bacterium]|nr:coenzyme F420-0:L-glutamate ligase [Anaerolineaceae bacterium]